MFAIGTPDLTVVLANLTDSIRDVGIPFGVVEEMEKITDALSFILSVMGDVDVDQPQPQQKVLQIWLRKLKDATFKMSEILDEGRTEALRQEIECQSSGHLNKVWNSAKSRYSGANLIFRRKIAFRMREIFSVIDAIARERSSFSRLSRNVFRDLRETGSYLTESEVFGREDDREKIVKVLTHDVWDLEDLSVYPITGMGGMGKTTLAQMIFNDERIQRHFSVRIWVYVSQEEKFDVKSVMKKIIESTSGIVTGAYVISANSPEEEGSEAEEYTSYSSMVEQVRMRLSSERYLLVLDDAWSQALDEWHHLNHVLACGLPGSCLVLTTRRENFALITGTLPGHSLSCLSEDDCWMLFRRHAFGSGVNEEQRPELVAVGREIVKKCGGLPLAAKSLGRLLRFKTEDEWTSIKESDIRSIPEEECPILPSLRLSYYDLPLAWRTCFSYCAVFLKGSLIEKDELIHLWMANGFISSTSTTEVEEVGNRIWAELYARSFFQDVDEDWRGKVYFRMHDLMHDLAQSIARDECQMVEAGTPSSRLSEGIRYATLVHKHTHESMASEALNGHGSLHTVILQHRDVSSSRYSSNSEFSWDFKNFGSLRAFDASETRMKRLAESVGNLKHLRYLNLSKTLLTELPPSLCGLYNLETLNLNDCSELQGLPKNTYNLINLRHLCLVNCDKIEDMPPGIGKLTRLKTLSLFVIGGSTDLGELRRLKLEGGLKIKHLERVRDVMEAKEANLAGKDKLRVLSLHWGRPESLEDIVDERVIETLQPHPNVKVLTIENYKGKRLPVWMESLSVLGNVVHIALRFCRNCLALPAFWLLPRLKLLKIDRMEKVEYITHNDTVPVAAFPSLEKLYISNLPNLKGLLMEGEGGPFPRLREMVIWRCPKLVLPKLPVLETLTIWDSTNTTVTSISELTSLTSLHLYHNGDLVSFPNGVFQGLNHLEILLISGFRKLKMLPENMSNLVALKKLSIESCEELTCLPGSGIGSPRSLLSMEIYHCPKIVCLPDSIQTLTKLQSLKFSYCNPELKRRCEKGQGEDWYKIAHVPQVIID